jgi:hypothetical protein
MSQTWVSDLYTTTTVIDTTMGNMESMFATLRTNFSGSSAPAQVTGQNIGQNWYDTTKKLLKVRNSTDANWRGILAGSASLKMWLYLNAAEEGWAIDAGSVTDRVLAFKGGSTYVTGGANAGTWTITGMAVSSHNHQWYEWASGQSKTWAANGSTQIYFNTWADKTTQALASRHKSQDAYRWNQQSYTKNAASTASGDGSWRPSGAVGTLQYPDV